MTKKDAAGATVGLRSGSFNENRCKRVDGAAGLDAQNVAYQTPATNGGSAPQAILRSSKADDCGERPIRASFQADSGNQT